MAGLFDMEGMQQDYARRKMEKEDRVMNRMAPVQPQAMSMENNFPPDSIEYMNQKRKIQQMQEQMRLAQEQAEIEARYAQNQPEQGFFSSLFGS